MKAQELAELLLENPEAEVILQKDSEGNGYSPLAGADSDAVYISVTDWHGEVYPIDWPAEDAGMDEEEWNKVKSNSKCIVLFPIN